MPKGKISQAGHGVAVKSGAVEPPKMGHGLLNSTESFNFTFSADNSSVTAFSETWTNSTTGTSTTKTLNLTGSTFATTVGTNDLGASAVVSVTETHTDKQGITTKIYTDQDGDGKYTESLDLSVANSSTARLPQHQFTFNTDGSIATDSLFCKNKARLDPITANEVYKSGVVNGETYITKTTAASDGKTYFYEVFRDSNKDGTWTEVAHGHSNGAQIDSATHSIQLSGIQTLLSASDGLIS